MKRNSAYKPIKKVLNQGNNKTKLKYSFIPIRLVKIKYDNIRVGNAVKQSI